MAKRGNIFQVTVGKRLPPLKKQIAEVLNEIQRDLIPVSKAHQRALEAIVKNWSTSTRPTFKAKTVVTAQRIGINITVKEADRKRPIWKWLDKTGTKPHKIPKQPKRAGVMRFRTGYKSKTKANPARFGGSGKATGPWRSAKQVQHPGFPPRKFSKKILKDMRPAYNRAIKNGARRGMRRAFRRSL